MLLDVLLELRHFLLKVNLLSLDQEKFLLRRVQAVSHRVVLKDDALPLGSEKNVALLEDQVHALACLCLGQQFDLLQARLILRLDHFDRLEELRALKSQHAK